MFCSVDSHPSCVVHQKYGRSELWRKGKCHTPFGIAIGCYPDPRRLSVPQSSLNDQTYQGRSKEEQEK